MDWLVFGDVWEPNISGLYIVCFMDLAIFVVELLICEHNSPEVVEALSQELQKLEDYKAL